MADESRKVVERTTTRRFSKKGRLVKETVFEIERWETVKPAWTFPTINYSPGTSTGRS